MKSYLLKSLGILLIVFAFGCSQEETLQPEEESITDKALLKAQNIALNNGERRTIHAILVECPQTNNNGTPSPQPTCPQDFPSSITIYNIDQSPNCPDIYLVWVDSEEYYAHFFSHEGETKHTLTPPYLAEPRIMTQEEYDNCFNQ